MITQELIAYIKSELNKGKTREEIRVILLRGGGWSEADISEAFRTVMPLSDAVLNMEPVSRAPIIASSISPIIKASLMSSSRAEKSTHKMPWIAIVLAVLFGAFLFVAFYFYRPQNAILPSKMTEIFNSIMIRVNNLVPKKETIPPVVVTEEIPKTPVVVVTTPINCGITNSPDRKNPSSYLTDNALKCLGVSALNCINAEGTINDTLFPTSFKIIDKDNVCKFELSYKEDSALVDVQGKKLALRNVSCPLSVVKTIDETDPKNILFKTANVNNPVVYATDIYFYGTLGLFMENNFDQNKIERLGCNGTFIGSMIESYKLMKSPI